MTSKISVCEREEKREKINFARKFLILIHFHSPFSLLVLAENMWVCRDRESKALKGARERQKKSEQMNM